MAQKTPTTTWLERFVSLNELNQLYVRARRQNLGFRLPAKFKQDVAFLDASLIQFFLTLDRWAVGNNRVILPFSNQKELAVFCRQPPVLALSLTEIAASYSDGRDARPDFQQTGESILEKYQSGGFEQLPSEFVDTGRAILLSSARGSLGHPGYFDLGDGSQPISRGDFLRGQEAVFEQLLETKRMSKKIALARADLLQTLGIVTHEFLTNASKFALKEIDGSRIDRTVRFLSYRIFSATDKSTNAADPVVERYIQNQRLGGNRFLEVSFFDSGPGLARHFLHNSDKVAEDQLHPDQLRGKAEIGGTLTCFNQLRSGERQIAQGFGLNDVFEVLTKVGAFVRVRTGRLDLFRDLGREPYDCEKHGPEVEFNHMATDSREVDFTGWAWGTLYSILLPWR